MRVTVLGKSPSWQDAGGACSGYLIEEGDTAVLMDCGNGVFSKLRRYRDYVDVDAVVLSHLHADHFFDLVPFASALTYGPRGGSPNGDGGPGAPPPARPVLHAPPGAAGAFRQVCGGGGMHEDHIARAFDLREYAPSDVLEAGPLRVRFKAVPHYLPTFAVEVSSTAGGAGRLAYSADSSPSDELVAFARGADLLLIEATLRHEEDDGVRGHLTAREAGEHGQRAAVGRVVLTHISDELDAARAREEASRSFDGDVVVAAEGAVFEI
jgi:ribonuclease BN (tRNA processing enzyme)